MDEHLTPGKVTDAPVDDYLPRLDEVLRLPELSRGSPLVVAGEDRLSVRIRWVHVSELPDIASLLEGGELILTTGIALPTESSKLQRYIDDLSVAAVSGVVMELGRKFREFPRALVERAEQRQFPLVALRREVRFVRVTEEVHRLIVDAHIDQLQASAQAHATFMELGIDGASPDAIVGRLVEMTGHPAVLENLTHQVVSFAAAGADEHQLLRDWERRSRLMASRERTAVVCEHPAWLATLVAARGEQWGRLLLQAEPTVHHRMMLEQAAMAIALNRLVERDRGTLERNAHRSLLARIAERTYSSAAEVAVRADALGVPLTGRLLVAAYIRVKRQGSDDGIEAHARRREDVERVAYATRTLGMPALVSALEPDGIGLLIPFVAHADIGPRLEQFSRTIHRLVAQAEPGASAVVAVGLPVDQIGEVRRSLHEAAHVSEATRTVGEDKLYYKLEDLRVRGLLHMIRGDPRLQTFVEHELGPLLDYDERHHTALLDVLSALLAHPGNKSAAAKQVGLSRPAFYERLERISRILGADLESAEVRLSLHLALSALDVMRAGQPRVW